MRKHLWTPSLLMNENFGKITRGTPAQLLENYFLSILATNAGQLHCKTAFSRIRFL